MAEKDQIFSSKIKSTGIFTFKDFYRFCYEWLNEETGLILNEDKYVEKVSGNTKEIEVKWTGFRKLTDYFKFESTIKFKITQMEDVEIVEGNKKTKTNKGAIEIAIKGVLVKDYEGKFEKTGFQKFLRGIYEKMVIPARVEQFEEKIMEDCDEFLSQAKAYLDLEGKR